MTAFRNACQRLSFPALCCAYSSDVRHIAAFSNRRVRKMLRLFRPVPYSSSHLAFSSYAPKQLDNAADVAHASSRAQAVQLGALVVGLFSIVLVPYTHITTFSRSGVFPGLCLDVSILMIPSAPLSAECALLEPCAALQRPRSSFSVLKYRVRSWGYLHTYCTL